MLTADQLVEIGEFNKPHGIKGELSMTLFNDAVDLNELRCVILEREGLPVPFFISSIRPKGAHTWLVTIDGIDSKEQAQSMVGETVLGLSSEVMPMIAKADEDFDDSDGMYAGQFIGMRVIADGRFLGEVTDIDDSTMNLLMIVTHPDSGEETMIPIASEFFEEIDPDTNTLTLNLPDGLV